MMTDDYAAEVRRTWVNEFVSSDVARKMHAALGLASEAGELAALLIKPTHYGKAAPARADVVGELGDALWYLTALANEYGISLDEIMAANVAKLRDRHPRGFDRNHYNDDARPRGALLDVVGAPRGSGPHGQVYRQGANNAGGEVAE